MSPLVTLTELSELYRDDTRRDMAAATMELRKVRDKKDELRSFLAALHDAF